MPHKWTIEEEIIVCEFYLKNGLRGGNVDDLMTQLFESGSSLTNKNSVKAKLANFEFLHTGKGLSKVSALSIEAYEKLKKKSSAKKKSRSKKLLTKVARGIQFGDVANIAIRNVLTLISRDYGEICDEEIIETCEFFDYKCPYTGRDLKEKIERRDKSLVSEHIVPQNRFDCGLNIKGNLVFVERDVNSAKAGNSFEDFIMNDTSVVTGTVEERRKRVEKIKAFQRLCNYNSDEIKKTISPLLCKIYYEIQENQSGYAEDSITALKKKKVLF